MPTDLTKLTDEELLALYRSRLPASDQQPVDLSRLSDDALLTLYRNRTAAQATPFTASIADTVRQMRQAGVAPSATTSMAWQQPQAAAVEADQEAKRRAAELEPRLREQEEKYRMRAALELSQRMGLPLDLLVQKPLTYDPSITQPIGQAIEKFGEATTGLPLVKKFVGEAKPVAGPPKSAVIPNYSKFRFTMKPEELKEYEVGHEAYQRIRDLLDRPTDAGKPVLRGFI